MSQMALTEFELLERVLLRLGCADSDEKLETCVSRFLTPVILKVSSPSDGVRAKVIEVLTHIKRRLTSRPNVQIPVEALLDQHNISKCPFVQNFTTIFIVMGFPRLSLETRTALASKILGCEQKLENNQNNLFMLLLPILGDIKVPDNPAERNKVLNLEKKSKNRSLFLDLMRDLLLLPYATMADQDVPPGMSVWSFKRISVEKWKAEDLEKYKNGIVRFICTGVFSEDEIFAHLVIAAADTRFSVATPALAELSRINTSLDFTDPNLTKPLYTLFCGSPSTVSDEDRKIKPCCPRVRQKLLQYLIKCRGKGIIVPLGIQVIFESLFGDNTNHKCKVLALQFCVHLTKNGPPDLIKKVSQILLTGITKLIGRESEVPADVQSAAYLALSCLAQTCPTSINQDLKIVLSCFSHLSVASPDLQTSIREALIALAPAFAWKPNSSPDAMEEEPGSIRLNEQQHMLLALLSNNTDTQPHVIQNVTGVFLTICYPEWYAPARLLLLLIAGERNLLRENMITYLYGATTKDLINYNMIVSIDHNEHRPEITSRKERHLVLPGFKDMMNHVNEIAAKRLEKSYSGTVVGRPELAFRFEAYDEILDYLRVCLWYSAGARCAPGEGKSLHKLKEYITKNYEPIESNELYCYFQFVQLGIEKKRSPTNLLCLYDLLNAAPEILTKNQVNLITQLTKSVKDVSEAMRVNVAQLLGFLIAHVYSDAEFNEQISETLRSFPTSTLEEKHGWLLTVGNCFWRKIELLKKSNTLRDTNQWPEFLNFVKLVAKTLSDNQWLLVSASVKCLSMIGQIIEIPSIEVEVSATSPVLKEDESKSEDCPKLAIFDLLFNLVRSGSMQAKVREDAAKCLGNLAIGDGAFFVERNMKNFLLLLKTPKDITLNIILAEAVASTITGYDVNTFVSPENVPPSHCNDELFGTFLETLIRQGVEPNPYGRQSCAIWLLAIVKHCSQRTVILNQKDKLQMVFIELLLDDSEFVQEVASRGLAIIYNLSDSNGRRDLTNSLLNQIINGKQSTKKVTTDAPLVVDDVSLANTTGGNIKTYKELCALATDLKKPELIYDFMQLANKNTTWTNKLSAAFDSTSSSTTDFTSNMEPYLGTIIPRLYRCKYDPSAKIQNSMQSLWNSIVPKPKETIEKYYWEILREILKNITAPEWPVRIACCLAVRDLLKRPSGLKLRSEEKSASPTKTTDTAMDVDSYAEPELHELWSQLFRVMDDLHEGTRVAAQTTATYLGKLCTGCSSSDNGKSSVAVVSSILPLLLETGITHPVAEIRKLSLSTISDMIDSSGAYITPHLHILIPCLLKATGELDSQKLAYMSTYLGSDNEAQEMIDNIRAESAKSHQTVKTLIKCVTFLDYPALERMTPGVLEVIKGSASLGTKVAATHFITLICNHFGQEITPLVSKYLGVCFAGLKEQNPIVRKHFANAIGYLIGFAKEPSIKRLFIKFDELYMESGCNRSIALAIQSINKRHHDLLRDYLEVVLPLVFFSAHEEPTEENRNTVELWKDLWNDIAPGDSGIRINMDVIVDKLEKTMKDAKWRHKMQAANVIKTIAIRLNVTIEESYRLRLINLVLTALHGRTFEGKARLLQALAALCKGLDHQNEICALIIEAALHECRKEEPKYRSLALISLGDILEELEADRFENVYSMIWHILEIQDCNNLSSEDSESYRQENDLTSEERNERVQTLNKLKEVVCDTLGKAWPKNSSKTQEKYQLEFSERCGVCIKTSTRQVQVSLLKALMKFVERLEVFGKDQPIENPAKQKKEMKLENEQHLNDVTIDKICHNILAVVSYSVAVPHTGLKKEALNIILILINRLSKTNDIRRLKIVKASFDAALEKIQRDTAPEISCRVRDIEDRIKLIL